MVRALEKRKTKMRYAILHPDRVFVAPLLVISLRRLCTKSDNPTHCRGWHFRFTIIALIFI